MKVAQYLKWRFRITQRFTINRIFRDICYAQVLSRYHFIFCKTFRRHYVIWVQGVAIGGREMLLETLAGDSFKCFKDHQNFRNLWIIFFARPAEPALFKWRPLRPKCLLVMFLLSSTSMFKSKKWSHRFLTASAALPLSHILVGVENGTSVWGKVSP